MDLSIEEAIEKLNNGEVIGVPTDTVYGLSSCLDYGEKIYEAKQRSHGKKLITMLHDYKCLEITNPVLKKRMEEVWPGAVTLIFEYNSEMTSFRIPNEPNLLLLLERLGKPIYTTSANISGEDPCLSREEFKQKFPNIGLLKEDIDSLKSAVPSEIYVFNNNQFERIR
ncbi:Sua5/YciO/YrdC/YwlC family protein [Mollicutes bacterium LVI A0039]|nr:Sua5/YciO/YrdC/YwlC family protein [Mollicutes bacterium LVI A0039]